MSLQICLFYKLKRHQTYNYVSIYKLFVHVITDVAATFSNRGDTGSNVPFNYLMDPSYSMAYIQRVVNEEYLLVNDLRNLPMQNKKIPTSSSTLLFLLLF